MKTKAKTVLTVRTHVKAGGIGFNHNRGLRVRASIKAGGIGFNHNRALKVKASIRSGYSPIAPNHSRNLLVSN